MTTGEKIDKLAATFNEIAIGYNDSGSFWHFQYGPRGSGSMILDIGYTFAAHDAESLDEALDALLAHLQI